MNTICIDVRDHVMDGPGKSAGASGSDRSAVLRMSFDASWAGLTKTVYFTDARGISSSERVLGLLDLTPGQEETYDVPIPASAMAYAGRATVTVRGVALDEDGETARALTTAALELRVLDSRLPEDVGELGAVDATAAEQLQAEVDGLKALFLSASSEAKTAAAAASASETKAKASEDAAKGSETKAKASEDAAKASETKAKASETQAKGSETKAKASEDAAKSSETKAKASETKAKASEDAAKASETKAKASEDAAKASEDAAKGSETKAKASEDAAKGSETKAKASEDAAKGSETKAKASEDAAESWAVGGTGTREGEETDNAKYWAQQAKATVGGDFVTGQEVQGYVTEHDQSGTAHPALRQALAEMGEAVLAELDGHAGDKGNPHGVTAAQVGALPLGGGTMTGDIELEMSSAIYLGVDSSVGSVCIGAPSGTASGFIGMDGEVALGVDNGSYRTVVRDLKAPVDADDAATKQYVDDEVGGHTHDMADLDGVLPVSKGGTGAATAEAALTALGGCATADIGDLHVWRKMVTTVAAGYDLGPVESGFLASGGSQNNSNSAVVFKHSFAVSVSTTGTVVLAAPVEETYTYTPDMAENIQRILRGKFVLMRAVSKSGYNSGTKEGIWFIPPDATISFITNGTSLGYPYSYCYVVDKMQKVQGHAQQLATTYLVSADRNAYQEGSSDTTPAGYALGEEEVGPFDLCTTTTDYWSWKYSSDLDIDDDGVISLRTPTSLTIRRDLSSTAADVLKGKFVYADTYNSPNFAKGTIYFVPEDATISRVVPADSNYYKFQLSKRQSVSGCAAVPPSTIIEYLGQLGSPGKRIEIGSYIGTGVVPSESNPMSLTFGFRPKLIHHSGLYMFVPLPVDELSTRYTQNFIWSAGSGSPSSVKLSKDEKTLTWYSGYNAATALNAEGKTYWYYAME